MKEVLNRTLNACYLVSPPIIVEFVFRLLRSLILDRETFELFPHSTSSAIVFNEFNYQFIKEFGFDAEMQVNQSDIFDFNQEWPNIAPFLVGLEAQYPVLQYWNRY